MADLDDASWSENDTANTAAPPAGWPAGMFPNQVEPTAQAMMGALKRWWNRINGVYGSAGASGAYAVTPLNTGFPTVYVHGERFTFKAHQPSVGNDTLNWNGRGPLNIQKPTTAGLVNIAANDIVANQRVDVIVDTVLNVFMLMTPPTASIVAPTGSIMDFAAAAAPAGWLICDGSSQLRSTYQALFNVIGTTYGAADGSHFNLPDLRGRIVVAAGQGTGLANRVLAATGGEETHTLTTPEMPVHAHGVTDPQHAHTIHPVVSGTASGSGTVGGGVIDWVNAIGATDAAATGIAIQNQGGGGAHNNMPPFLVLNKIIKT